MQISFNCPKCSNTLQADTNWSGQNTLCPHCKNMIIIPSSSTPPPAVKYTESVRTTPVSSVESEFFLLKIFNALFAKLRTMPIFGTLSKSGNILGKTGALCYIALGIVIFFISCKKSANAPSAWVEIFNGIALLAGLVIFSACGMYMFKLYNKIFTKEKGCTVPLPFLNAV